MPEDHIKSRLSVHYFETMAANVGYKIIEPIGDYGVDLILRSILQTGIVGSSRYFESVEIFDIQLKCTTIGSVETQNDHLIFQLPAKNYNDLVRRENTFEISNGRYIPLFLVLIVLSEDRPNWVSMSTANDQLVISGRAFWFRLPAGLQPTENQFSKKISIPLANQITPLNFTQIFQ